MENNNQPDEKLTFFNNYGLDKPKPKLNMDSSERLQDILRRSEQNCMKKFPGIDVTNSNLFLPSRNACQLCPM